MRRCEKRSDGEEEKQEEGGAGNKEKKKRKNRNLVIKNVGFNIGGGGNHFVANGVDDSFT